MARPDTDAAIRSSDVVSGPEFITVLLINEKCKRHKKERRILNISSAEVPLLRAALLKWVVLRDAAFQAAGLPSPPPLFWLLPHELGSRATASALCTAWMGIATAYLGAQPPVGGSWSAQSLRSGAASACNALNVALPTTRYWGGWAASSSVVNDYIDPTVRADVAAYAFFGWLLPATTNHLRVAAATAAAPLARRE